MSSRIAICLYNEDISELNNPKLVGGADIHRANMDPQNEGNAIFFYRSSPPATPEWVEIAKGFASLGQVDLSTSSSGGILLLKIKNRIMGCCFGSSVSNVNREEIVEDFGLGVAYSRILPRNTKSIESFTLSANPITNNRSAAIPTNQGNFNVDLNLENITELSGFVYSKSRHILIKGKEFFSTPSPLNLREIIELCEHLLIDYIDASRDDNYIRLTSTRKIKSKNLINILNDELIKKIKKKEDVFLVDFELRENVGGYKLSPKGDILPSLSIDDLYGEIPPRGVTIAYLKVKEVYPYDQNDQALPAWKVFKCLFSEVNIGTNSYILYKGNWYGIDNAYLDGLRDFIRQHEIDNLDEILCTVWDGNMDEGDFNDLAAANAGGQCWDKKGYRHPNFDYPIEFCDILTSDFIIHMKKLKSSALNSHLLMQTAVSAQLLTNDPGLREWIAEISKKVFRRNILLTRTRELKNPRTSYLIGLMSTSQKSLADSLPFFSLISFNFVIKRIQQSGFDVALGKV